ncbi:DUF1769-domain-containing protein [Dendrothele bispora CBS 962.96]|uniref:DUF1769-domain-containing protein n=1 Tax=Dendrothele bispora (strain CBS 962.96) TaxID=1314807 RepID=A0A4S8M6W5_DENBC|nr:DUF1769-domain-containing protein [Dendrothele bispora CBS 962.96]
MPGLRVLAGTSLDALVPITEFVNTNKTFKFPTSDRFEGEVICNIKGFEDGKESEYFEREDRKGVTWSIQVQGRFLKQYSADDILFGNTFDRPLHLPWGSSAALKFMNYIDPTLTHDLASPTKPWALSPLISTMPHFAHTRLVSSTDNPDTPACSPVDPDVPEFPSNQSLSDDTSQLHLAIVSPTTSSSSSPDSSPPTSASSSSSSLSSLSSSSNHSSNTSMSKHSEGTAAAAIVDSSGKGSAKSSSSSHTTKSTLSKLGKLKTKTHRSSKHHSSGMSADKVKSKKPLNLGTASQRRSYFSNVEHRKDVVFGPEDIISTDFCYGFLQFSPSLSLRLPGGVSFDLMKYWDGQPVRFVCCERKREGEDRDDGVNGQDDKGNDEDGNGDVPWGKVFWCVAIEPA